MTRPNLIISGVILLATLISGFIWLTNATTPRWGQFFEPHSIDRTLAVSPQYSYTQELVPEYQRLAVILLKVADPSPNSQLQVTVSSDQVEQIIPVSVSDALPTGELPVALPQPLAGTPRKPLKITVAHLSGPKVQLRFHLNEKDDLLGKLSRLNRQTSTDAPHSGYISFRAQYQATLAEQAGLNSFTYLAGSLAIIIGWLLFLRYRPAGSIFFPRPKWQRSELIALAIPTLLVLVLFGLALGPTLQQLPVMHDFIKDALYLNATTQALQQGQLPHWQHVTCGGQPHLGNPETNIISLGTLISPLTGPVAGLKLMIILEVALIAAGAYILGRLIGLSPVGAIVPALLLPLSGFVTGRVIIGHTNFIGGLAYLPWTAATFILGLKQRRWLIVTAALISLTLWRGDTHLVMYLCIMLALWSIYLAIFHRKARVLIALSIVAVFCIALSLPRLLPVVSSTDHYNSNSLPEFYAPLTSAHMLDNVFGAKQGEPINLVDGEDEDWENIGIYVGWVAVSLAAFGLLVTPPSIRWLLVVTITTFLILGEGELYGQWLRQLPYLGTLLRLPSRLLIIVVLAGSIAAGFLIDHLIRNRHHAGRLAAALLLCLLLFDLVPHAYSSLKRAEFIAPAQATPASALTATPYNPKDPTKHPITLINSGVTTPGFCLDFNKQPPFKTDIEAPLATNQTGQAIPVGLAQNSITITNPPPPNQKIFLRMVDSPLLSVSGGYTLAPQEDGLLPIVITTTNQPLILTYNSPVFWPALFLATGILAALTILSRE